MIEKLKTLKDFELNENDDAWCCGNDAMIGKARREAIKWVKALEKDKKNKTMGDSNGYLFYEHKIIIRWIKHFFG